MLQSGDPDLSAKSASARKLGSTRVIGRQDIVYSTEKGTDEQVNAREADEFDRRLGGSWGRNGGSQQQQQLPQGRSNRIDDVFGRREGRGGVQQRQRQSQEIEVDWEGRGGAGGSGGSSRQRPPQQRRQDQADWDRLNRW